MVVNKRKKNTRQRAKTTQGNGVFVIELRKVGYNKLLSSGKVTKKLKITVPIASPKAVEKVQQAGGTVELKK